MSNQTAVMLICAIRSVATVAAIAGAVFLAYHSKEGWGWLVFIALVIGTYSVSFNSTP